MAHDHHPHGHGHGHHHHHHHATGNRLYWAVAINLLLTVFQVIGGFFSGSLSLLADALHNFSDAGALGIAAVAARIAHLPANRKMTYGYKRAEILGALINSTTLVVVGFYLIYEAGVRYFAQRPIDGWTVIGVASVALVIDLATAWLTYSGSKDNVNMRAAFIHNLSDAAASVVVIVSGVLILNFQIYFVDLIATVLISAYVLVHGFGLIRKCIFILMQSTPEHLNVEEIKSRIEKVDKVREAHHLHVWQLDDQKILLEGHVCIAETDLSVLEDIKSEVRKVLKEDYEIEHSTLEIEVSSRCRVGEH